VTTVASELLANQRKYNELVDKWRKRLGPEAFKCPKCGSDDYAEWLIGWRPSEDHYHDPNRKTCTGCGHHWWVVCPCGHTYAREEE
jgi:hypothetical protein